MRARRGTRALKQQRDYYQKAYLAGSPASEALRQRLERGEGTADELARFGELRRAYEDYEATFNDELLAPGSTAPKRARWHELANVYEVDYAKKPELRRILEQGGGTAEQRTRYEEVREAYKAHRRLLRRKYGRIPREELEYPGQAKPEVSKLESLRHDAHQYNDLRRHPAKMEAFRADD